MLLLIDRKAKIGFLLFSLKYGEFSIHMAMQTLLYDSCDQLSPFYKNIRGPLTSRPQMLKKSTAIQINKSNF